MKTTDTNSLQPTFSSSFGNGWDKGFGTSFLSLFLVVILVGMLEAPAKFLQVRFNAGDIETGINHLDLFGAGLAAIGVLLFLFGLVYALLLLPVFTYGSKLMFVKATRGIRPDFECLIQGFRENYLYIILAHLLTIALIGMAFIALIIPGIIVACRLSFVSYLVMDKKLDPIAAVEESWRMTKGHAWTIFFMAIVSFFILIGGILLLIVGVFPALVWIKSSFASLYNAILLEKEGQQMEE